MQRVRFPLAEPRGAWELSLDAAEARIVGGSVAALATAFALPGWRTAVDMGRCSALLAAQDTVLLTHCHSDHVAGLLAWLSAHSRRHREAPLQVAVPAARREALLRALEVWPDLDGVRRRVDLAEALIASEVGSHLELAHGGWARAIPAHHNTPALGWKVGVSDEERARVAFAGDGTVEPFRADPGLLDATVAVVECSQVEPGTRVAARLAGHSHLADWLELEGDLPCDILVLAHLPAELEAERMLELLDGLPRGGPLVVPWLALLPERHQARGGHG